MSRMYLSHIIFCVCLGLAYVNENELYCDQSMKNEISLCKNHIVPDENVPESQIKFMGQLHFTYVFKEVFNHNSYFLINFKLLKGHMVLDNNDILFKN